MWIRRAVPLLVLFTLLASLAGPVASGDEPTVDLKLTIERVYEIATIDGDGTCPDFYPQVTIAGKEFGSRGMNQEDCDRSPDWEFVVEDLSLDDSPVTAVIELWDSDGLFDPGANPDDQADIDPDPSGFSLNLTVQFAPCEVRGDASGDCDSTIVSEGDDSEDAAGIEFRVEVLEPPTAPGLRVRCIHDPLWPQPGEEVTITAESLDGALGDEIADTIEIWVEDRSEPTHTENGAVETTFTAGPFDEGPFSYGCRVRDEGDAVFTGWRLVRVGEPEEEPVPVLFNGPERNRADILLVPEEDSYSGALDPEWLDDALSVVRDAYYDEDVFLSQQRRVNFWLAQDTGSVDVKEVDDGPDECTNLGGPDAFGLDYAFADSAGVFHTEGCRDLASSRLFSSDPSRDRIVLHETGHSPFGLADEYCCDGGYWEKSVNPNVYDKREICAEDASDVGRKKSACRNWTDEDGNTWWTSDPKDDGKIYANDDLMNDNGPAQKLDLRRINGWLDRCMPEDTRC